MIELLDQGVVWAGAFLLAVIWVCYMVAVYEQRMREASERLARPTDKGNGGWPLREDCRECGAPAYCDCHLRERDEWREEMASW